MAQALEYLETLVQVDENRLAYQRVTAAQPSGDLVASGSCPRCAHATQQAIETEAVTIAAASSRGEPPVAVGVTRMFRCHCSEPHEGRPQSVHTGCGAYWFAQVTGGPENY